MSPIVDINRRLERRETSEAITDLHGGADSLLEIVRSWQSVPPTHTSIDLAHRTVAGLTRLLAEIRHGMPADPSPSAA